MSKRPGINATRDVLKDQLALAAGEIERLRGFRMDAEVALDVTADLLRFLTGRTFCGRAAGWLIGRGWK